jgi:hypothetical protein
MHRLSPASPYASSTIHRVTIYISIVHTSIFVNCRGDERGRHAWSSMNTGDFSFSKRGAVELTPIPYNPVKLDRGEWSSREKSGHRNALVNTIN